MQIGHLSGFPRAAREISQCASVQLCSLRFSVFRLIQIRICKIKDAGVTLHFPLRKKRIESQNFSTLQAFLTQRKFHHDSVLGVNSYLAAQGARIDEAKNDVERANMQMLNSTR